MSLLEQINKLSNDFYDLIPQMNYNYDKLSPISTESDLDEQLFTINQVSNAHIAIRILMGAKYSMQNNLMNPFEYVYRTLNIKLQLMNTKEAETQYILRYITNSTQKSDVNIKRIFKFERQKEVNRFKETKLPNSTSTIKQKNRILLWHGTNTENLISIMSNGLVIAPRSSKHNGNLFGRGIYFSDSFDLSSSYSNGIQDCKKTRKYMLLCEVALGNVKELHNCEIVDTLPDRYDSVKALGRFGPNPNGNISLPNGVMCPLGELTEMKGSKFGPWRSLSNNQYVIYDESQVVIRYIIQYYE